MKEIDYKFQMVENIQKMVEFSMNELESDKKSQLSKMASIITKIKFEKCYARFHYGDYYNPNVFC